MDQVIKEKWLTALRSGDFSQTTGVLEHKGSFCCLGVLCSLAVEDGVIQRNDSHEGIYYGTHGDESALVLPVGVMEWANIDSNPLIVDEYGNTSLADLNDGGKTFEEIADFIEEQL